MFKRFAKHPRDKLAVASVNFSFWDFQVIRMTQYTDSVFHTLEK